MTVVEETDILGDCMGFILVFTALIFSSVASATVTGSFEGTSAKGVLAGWAASSSHPSSAVSVHVYADGPAGKGNFIGSAMTSISRVDVANVHGYGAMSGFNFTLPSRYFDNVAHTYYIYAIDPAGVQNPLLYGAPKTLTLNPAALSKITGYLDNTSTSAGVLKGWAASSAYPARALSIHIYADGPAGTGSFLGAVSANLPRADVAAVMGYGANSGYELTLPSRYIDGQAHSYYAYAIDPDGIYNPLLQNAPRTFTFNLKMIRCQVEAQTCPNQGYWDRMLVTNDNYNGSATDMNACMARLIDYRMWCGRGPEIRVTAFGEGGVLLKSSVSAGYSVRAVSGGPAIDGSEPQANIATFYADAYGARADGATDSTLAIQNALNAAVAAKRVAKVVLSAGTYRVNCRGADLPCFTISGASHVTLAGMSSTATKILIGNPRAGGFSVRSSDHVYFRDFSVDYATPPVAQGTIVSLGNGQMNVQFDAGFPLPNNTSAFVPGNSGLSFGIVFEPRTLTVRQPDAMHGLGFRQLSANVVEVSQVPSGAGFAVGDKFVYPVRNQQPTFYFKQSSNIGVRGVTQYAAPDVALQFVQVSGSVVINAFQLIRAQGRVLTASGGGIWAMNNSARIVVKNSVFEGMGDDVLDLMTQGLAITQMMSATRFLTQSSTYLGLASAGSAVQVTRSNGSLIGSMALAAQVATSGSSFDVQTVLPISGIGRGDVMFLTESAAPGSLFVNNRVGTFRGAARLHSAGAIVQNNSFANSGNGLFVIAADIQSTWSEGPSLGVDGNLPAPHFIDNSAGGANVRLVAPNWGSTSAAPE